MFLFNENAAFKASLEQEFFGLRSGNAQRRSCVYLFQGTVPQSLSEIPFNLDNPVDVARNSIGYFLAEFLPGEEPTELEYTALSEQAEIPTEFKSHYFDSDRNMWRLYPSVVCNEVSYTVLEQDQADKQNLSDAYRYLCSMGLIVYSDVDKYVSVEANTQLYATKSRYPYSDPYVWEFDQTVTLDHMFLKQTHSGSSYDNTYFDIQVWDDTLNEGQGDWADSTRISYAGGNTANEIAIPAITGQKFRIAGGDTGSRGWLLKNFTFFSNTEPTVSTVDCTWALLGTGVNGVVNLHTASDVDTDSFRPDDGYHLSYLPWALVDAGDPNTESSLVLETASNINGKTAVSPLSLRLIL